MNYNSSEQTIGWFKDRYLEGNLEIKPPYQRRPVWAPRQKSNLVESILLGLPVPEIYIHSTTSAEGATHYAVVDGQQRVRSVLQFVGIDKEEGEKEFNGFPLEGLQEDSAWRNTTFADLAPKKREKFFGYKLSVRFLTEATDEDVREFTCRRRLLGGKPRGLACDYPANERHRVHKRITDRPNGWPPGRKRPSHRRLLPTHGRV
jgi:hypothetical protein